MRQFYICIFFILSTVSELLAGVKSENNKPFEINGVVIDALTGNPLEFATISILNLGDSSLVDGTITDLKGQFILQPKAGK